MKEVKCIYVMFKSYDGADKLKIPFPEPSFTLNEVAECMIYILNNYRLEVEDIQYGMIPYYCAKLNAELKENIKL